MPKFEIYKESLFGKYPPVKEVAEMMRFNDLMSRAIFALEPEVMTPVYAAAVRLIPLKKRMEKAREHLTKAKRKLEEMGV